MSLSEDARRELERWLEHADRKLWMQIEERRSARTARNIAVLSVVLTLLAVFGGPALLDSITQNAIDEAVKRVTADIKSETEKLEQQAKAALANADVASKVVQERSARAEENSKRATEQAANALKSAQSANTKANEANEEITILIAELESEAKKLDDRLARLHADTSHARNTIEIQITTLREQLQIVSTVANADEELENVKGQYETKLASFQQNSEFLLEIVSASITEDYQDRSKEISAESMKFREILEKMGYRVSLVSGWSGYFLSMMEDNPGHDIYVQVELDSSLEDKLSGHLQEVSSLITTEFDKPPVEISKPDYMIGNIEGPAIVIWLGKPLEPEGQ